LSIPGFHFLTVVDVLALIVLNPGNTALKTGEAVTPLRPGPRDIPFSLPYDTGAGSEFLVIEEAGLTRQASAFLA
jgi:hypothetical protein